MANPEAELSCSSSTIIDRDLRPTGQRKCRIVIEATVDDPSLPQSPTLITPDILRQMRATAGYLDDAHTADGSLVIHQEQELDEAGLNTLKSTITITGRGDGDEELNMRGARCLECFRFPLVTLASSTTICPPMIPYRRRDWGL